MLIILINQLIIKKLINKYLIYINTLNIAFVYIKNNNIY